VRAIVSEESCPDLTSIEALLGDPGGVCICAQNLVSSSAIAPSATTRHGVSVDDLASRHPHAVQVQHNDAYWLLTTEIE
jgi:hypothetical protein